MPYMVTFTINIPPMLAYIPYMDPMGLASQTKKSGVSLNRSGHHLDTFESIVFNEILAEVHWKDGGWDRRIKHGSGKLPDRFQIDSSSIP